MDNETVEWVNGPALEVLLALRGLQVGDQVLVDPKISIEGTGAPISLGEKITVATIEQVWPFGLHENSNRTIAHCGPGIMGSGSTYIAKENILAWKRPKTAG